MKKYSSNSVISISVTLPNKKSTRISFSALSDGSSVYYTTDKDVQWALEHHYKYGKLFRLSGESSEKDQPPTQKLKGQKKSGKKTDKSPKAATPDNHSQAINNDETQEELPEDTEGNEGDDTEGNEGDDTETSEGVTETSGYKEVEVSDMDAAKDYLAENYEVVRTKLKSEESIRKAALSFGIVFKTL